MRHRLLLLLVPLTFALGGARGSAGASSDFS